MSSGPSPRRRPVNLGEVTLDHNGNAHLKATTDLQTFGMIVTAEPYFAVTSPATWLSMESAPLSGAATENIEAKYELVSRGTYSSTNTHIQDAIFGIDSKTPLELFEARNALRIAHIAAADKYAAFNPVQGRTAADACRRNLPPEAKQGTAIEPPRKKRPKPPKKPASWP